MRHLNKLNISTTQTAIASRMYGTAEQSGGKPNGRAIAINSIALARPQSLPHWNPAWHSTTRKSLLHRKARTLIRAGQGIRHNHSSNDGQTNGMLEETASTNRAVMASRRRTLTVIRTIIVSQSTVAIENVWLWQLSEHPDGVH